VQGNGRGTSDTRAACIDAETLAAWADGGLPRAEAALVETHLADCERCTAMVATFARTIPDAPIAEPLWKRWHLRWLVPVATAATVAAFWVLVPRPESPRMTPSSAVARSDSQASIESQVSGTGGAAQQPATPSENKEQAAQFRVAEPKPADAVAKREAPPSAPRQLAGAGGNRDEKLQQPLPLNESVAIAPSAPSPAREADREEAKSADAQTERFSPTVPSVNAAPPPAAAPAAPEASRTREAAAARASAPAPTSQPTFRAASGQAGAIASARDQATIVEIASPDPMTRWRVIGAGRVERSTNGGARWEPATLPESATLISGSSPSSSICWLVGRAGSIYVTTDGLRFVRVPFTDRTDFVSIRATDGRRATVVTIDGRTMRTDDQGANWIRVNP
jgi:hypothetical protein